MKASLYALTTALVVAAAAPSALSAAPQDETAIRQVCLNFATAWNHHDPKAMAAVWTDDGDLINPHGAAAKGRAAVEKLLEHEQASMMTGTTYSIADNSVRLLSPTIATADWTGEVDGIKTPEGVVLPPFKHHVFVVLEKKNGQWSFANARAFAFLVAPPMPGIPAQP